MPLNLQKAGEDASFYHLRLPEMFPESTPLLLFSEESFFIVVYGCLEGVELVYQASVTEFLKQVIPYAEVGFVVLACSHIA